MKKDHIRDYATEAFRFYANIGMSAMEYKEKVRQEAMETIAKRESSPKVGGSPTESLLIYGEKAVEERISEIDDLEAVERTLKELEANVYGKAVILPLIKTVYFTECDRDIKKGEIRDRVLKACTELNIGESTAYRYLKKARVLFAHNRKLRAGEI